MSGKLKKQLYYIIAAAVIFAVILVADKTGAFPQVFSKWHISLLLYMIPWLICGWSVVRKAVLGVIHGQMMDECFLMTIASIGAFAVGEHAEAAAVMLFYQIGEFFQGYAVGRSRESIRDLMDIAPEYAHVEREDRTIETIDPDEVETGDILVIKPGEKIPVDAEVIEGSSMINTAALTGESVPCSAGPGVNVISGCVNGDGLLRVRALKTYDDSAVARILEMVENASEKKSRTENFITRFARVYTPAVVICALLTAIIPSIITRDPMTWIYRACTFLVISCPCALVISVPLAFFGGIGAASRQGLLVKGSDYLEQMARLGTLVFDKTGTLTKGEFKVTGIVTADGSSREKVLMYAAWAESLSTHPIALSIREAWNKENVISGLPENPEDLENIPGLGIIASSGSTKVCAGSMGLMKKCGIPCAEEDDPAATVVYVAADGRYLGAIKICDEIKPGTADALMKLRREGVKKLVMLTGDRRRVAEAVAGKLGLDEAVSELLPQDKVSCLERLLGDQGRSGVLAYAGDGINDAPVLMRADVGIAMGSLGSDAAIEAADVIIMDDDLARIPDLMRIARKTVNIASQNIVFALFVKFLILILGAFGIANMWAAVFADVGVAVLCILNSMRQ